MDIHAVWSWIISNPVADVAVVAWVIVNVVPRPHPDASEPGWQKVLWTAIDRISILTASQLPGNFKWIFAASPPLPRDEATTPVEVPAVKKEEKEP